MVDDSFSHGVGHMIKTPTYFTILVCMYSRMASGYELDFELREDTP